MTANDVVKRALIIGSKCSYWYGAKRQKPTKELANILKASNPSVWNQAYYEAALKDVGSNKLVCDCSGLVCYAIDIPDIGTYTMKTSGRLIPYGSIPREGEFTPGTVALKPGHCGIVIDAYGHIAEMRGLRYDFCKTRTFKECGFTELYKAKNVNYAGQSEYRTGWNRDNIGWWYAYGPKRGEYFKSGFKKIGNAWYHFNAAGYIDTGFFKADGFYFYSDDNGILTSNRKASANSVEELKKNHSLWRITT